MRPLLVRPSPIANESTTGYLLRLSDANGFASLLDLDHLARIEGGTAGIASVGSMLPGTSLQSLRGSVTRFRHLKSRDPGGLDLNHWNGRRPRYCPLCLSSEPYWRGAWDLSLMVACPIHRTQLCDSCPSCCRPLSWRRRHLLTCDCGRRFADTSAMKATDSCAAICTRLLAALTETPGQYPMLADVRGEDLALSDFLAVCAFLGGYVSQTASKPTKVANLDHISVATPIVQAAGGMLIGWPTEYHAFLRRVSEATAEGDTYTSLAKTFGYFYTSLYKRFCGSQFEFLRSEFDSFVRNEWVGQLARRNRRLSETTRMEHQWLPLTAAAKRLGVKRDAICALISKGAIKGQVRKTPSGRTMGTVSRDSLEVFRNEMRQRLTLTDVRRVLSLSRKRAYALLRSGELRPIGGPSIDGSTVWRFLQSDVHALESKIRGVV